MAIANELRHRVRIQCLTEPFRDENGFEIQSPTWQDYCCCYAKITPLSSNDLIRSQAQNSKVTARMKLRFRTDITSDMRVIFNHKIYDIDSQAIADNVTGNQWITFNLSGGVEHYKDEER